MKRIVSLVLVITFCAFPAQARPKCAVERMVPGISGPVVEISSRRAFCPNDSSFAYHLVSSKLSKDTKSLRRWRVKEVNGPFTDNVLPNNGRVITLIGDTVMIGNYQLSLIAIKNEGKRLQFRVLKTGAGIVGICAPEEFIQLAPGAYVRDSFKLNVNDMVCHAGSEYAYLLEEFRITSKSNWAAIIRLIPSFDPGANHHGNSFDWLGKRIELTDASPLFRFGRAEISAELLPDRRLGIMMRTGAEPPVEPRWYEPTDRSCPAWLVPVCYRAPNGEVKSFEGCLFEDLGLPAGSMTSCDQLGDGKVLKNKSCATLSSTVDRGDRDYIDLAWLAYKLENGSLLCDETSEYSFVLDLFDYTSPTNWKAYFRVVPGLLVRNPFSYPWLGMRFVLSSDVSEIRVNTIDIFARVENGSLYVTKKLTGQPPVQPKWDDSYPPAFMRVCTLAIEYGQLPNCSIRSFANSCSFFDSSLPSQWPGC